MPSLEENLLTQRHEIWSQQTRDSTLSRGINTESLSPELESVPGRDRHHDGRTDRITIASTRLALRAVARKNLSQKP